MKNLKSSYAISLAILIFFLSTNRTTGDKNKVLYERMKKISEKIKTDNPEIAYTNVYFDEHLEFASYGKGHLFIKGLVLKNKTNIELYLTTPTRFGVDNSVFIDTTNKIIFIDLQRFGNHGAFDFLINPNIYVPVYQNSKMRLNLRLNFYLKDSLNLYNPDLRIGLSQNFEKIFVENQNVEDYSVIVKATLSNYDDGRATWEHMADSSNKPFFTTMITKPIKLRK